MDHYRVDEEQQTDSSDEEQYSAPKLVKYGAVKTLTAGGSRGRKESRRGRRTG